MNYVVIQLDQRAADGSTHRMVNETTGHTVSWGVMQVLGPLAPGSMGAHHVRYMARRSEPLPPPRRHEAMIHENIVLGPPGDHVGLYTGTPLKRRRWTRKHV